MLDCGTATSARIVFVSFSSGRMEAYVPEALNIKNSVQ
jgi:hypothetical protein